MLGAIMELACVLEVCSVPWLEVKILVDFGLEKIPIPLKIFLSALNKLLKGLMASFYSSFFMSSAPFGSSVDGFLIRINYYNLL